MKANGLYCWQLMLLDPAHQIPRPFVSKCYLSNSVVKKAPFGLSTYRVKEEPVQVLSSSSVGLQCRTALVVLPLFRPSSDSDLLGISSPAVSKEPRNCLKEQVKTSNEV